MTKEIRCPLDPLTQDHDLLINIFFILSICEDLHLHLDQSVELS
jgi:hypothetical protein